MLDVTKLFEQSETLFSKNESVEFLTETVDLHVCSDEAFKEYFCFFLKEENEIICWSEGPFHFPRFFVEFLTNMEKKTEPYKSLLYKYNKSKYQSRAVTIDYALSD